MKSLTSLILAIAFVGWNFFFWSFSFRTPKVFWNTNRPLGLVTILLSFSAYQQLYHKRIHSIKFCTHWSLLLQLSFTIICLPLNPCSRQALNSIFCQGKCFHSLWRNVSKTTHAWLSRKVTLWTFPQSSVLFVSILSGSSFQVHVSPHWRCRQLACNKIFLHSPNKMKQHRAYSVIVRPRKTVWQPILSEGEALNDPLLFVTMYQSPVRQIPGKKTKRVTIEKSKLCLLSLKLPQLSLIPTII